MSAGVSTDVGSGATRKSIHHFCCSDPAIELPFPLQSLSMALHVPSKFQGIHSVLTVDTGKEMTGANSTDHPNSPKDEEENNSCPTHRFSASDPPPDNRDADLDPAYAGATSRVFKVGSSLCFLPRFYFWQLWLSLCIDNSNWFFSKFRSSYDENSTWSISLFAPDLWWNFPQFFEWNELKIWFTRQDTGPCRKKWVPLDREINGKSKGSILLVTSGRIWCWSVGNTELQKKRAGQLLRLWLAR